MSLSREKREQAKLYLLEQIDARDSDYIAKTASNFGLTVQSVYRYVRELAEDGIIEKAGKDWRLHRESSQVHISTADLQNYGDSYSYDQFYEQFLASLPDNAVGIWSFGLSEMTNNVIDHSQSSEVLFIMMSDYLNTYAIIADDGIGLFQKIKEHFHLASLDEAVAALFPGKLTTDAQNHSGEGIFFTSRLMDQFAAVSNGKVFTHNNFEEAVQNLDDNIEFISWRSWQGTIIEMSLSNTTRKNASDIFNEYADVDGGFTRTTLPLRHIFPRNPVSRSQAKRLSQRFTDFEEVTLDFQDIEWIGQGFAHELYVVWQKKHPEIQLKTVNANEAVTKMVYHVMHS